MGSASARLVLAFLLASAIQYASADEMVASVSIIPGPDSAFGEGYEGPRIVGAAVAMEPPEPAQATLPRATVKYAADGGDGGQETGTSTTVADAPAPHAAEGGIWDSILGFIGKLL